MLNEHGIGWDAWTEFRPELLEEMPWVWVVRVNGVMLATGYAASETLADRTARNVLYMSQKRM